MRILLIGGCGYIGTRLYAHLKRGGYNVESVDLELHGNTRGGANYKGDFDDLSSQLLGIYDTVILLAGFASPRAGSKFGPTFELNVAKFMRLVGKLQPHQKFIYASSSSVYAEERYPSSEASTSFGLTNPYDISKKHIDDWIKLTDLNYYGLRLGTVCGYSPNFRNDTAINKMYCDSLEGPITLLTQENQANRAIIGMNDLLRVITTILDSDLRFPGIYNAASFNISIPQIADIYERRGATVIRKPNPQPSQYSFRINSSKFSFNFNFEFQDTPNSIIKELEDNYHKIVRFEGRN